jgi:hypothetical protein
MSATEQRHRALARANDIRMHRAHLKAELRAGRASIKPLVSEPPEWLLTATIQEMLLAVPDVGPSKVERILRRARVSPRTTFGTVTPRGRKALLQTLDKAAFHTDEMDLGELLHELRTLRDGYGLRSLSVDLRLPTGRNINITFWKNGTSAVSSDGDEFDLARLA